ELCQSAGPHSPRGCCAYESDITSLFSFRAPLVARVESAPPCHIGGFDIILLRKIKRVSQNDKLVEFRHSVVGEFTSWGDRARSPGQRPTTRRALSTCRCRAPFCPAPTARGRRARSRCVERPQWG